ncbi:hypothetical protein SDC9_172815 [bioreactor metagenome]|uniref:Uncharacterized protein n=1 Tax=bioreactor metagenome TaxID=1076179 RepID=A0A645GGU4_9ZZZZ
MRFGWINIFHGVIVALLLIPNLVYALRRPSAAVHQKPGRLLGLAEQVGRYGCMLLMVVNLGLTEFGFSSKGAFVLWLLGNGVLLLVYWVCWLFYFKRPVKRRAVVLAVAPGLLFLLNGLILRHWALVGCAVLFCAAHPRVALAGLERGD